MNDRLASRRAKAKDIFRTAGLYCLTDSQLAGERGNLAVVEQMLAAGAQIIQYREKNKTQLEMYRECMLIRDMTRMQGATFFVNDDIALAMAVCADGVHIGQDDLPLPVVRQLVGEGMLIGLSTHSPQQARAAVELGADYIGVGPVYQTQTKKDVCAPVGLEYVNYVAKCIDLAFVAIGGISRDNLTAVIEHGAECVAMISEIIKAADIRQTVQSVRSEIQTAQALRG